MPLFIFTPIYRTTETANGAGLTLEDYRAAIRAWVTAKASARIKLVEMSGSGITDADLTDGLHPSDAGHAKITAAATPQIAAFYGIAR
jgi:lysophospholipase L1-like esterase